MTKIGLALALVTAAALLAAGGALASPTARMGIQDDAWLRWGPGTLAERLDTLDGLGVRTVRFTLVWREVAQHAPADGRDPADPAYDWAPFDAVLDGLHAHGITPLVTIWGAPAWSNGGHPANWLPKSGFGNFAYAASRRYPWIRLWTVWNEPNTAVFSRPVSPTLYVRRLLNPAYALLHRANRRNLVGGGVTSPRATASGMAPTAFMQGMRAAHARLDAYAANPYPSSKLETPFFNPCSWCRTLTMARLPQIRALVTELFGRSKPLWLTEYGVPDESARPAPRRLAGTPGADDRSGGAAGVAAARRHRPHPLPRQGRAEHRRLAERALHGARHREAREACVRASARADVAAWEPHRALGPGAARQRPPAVRDPALDAGSRWVNVGGVEAHRRRRHVPHSPSGRQGDEGAVRATQLGYPSPLLVIA